MQIIEMLLTKNRCYKSNRKITVKGLMLHSVGTPQPSAKVFINRWNNPNVSKCVHAFIDANNGNVYQTLPWTRRAWHCGASGNNTHIGVEMCEPSQIKYTSGSKFTCSNLEEARKSAKRTYDSAVKLFAKLCRKFGLNPLTDIVSHNEGHQKGIASNHGDPEHLWKGLGLNYTMNGFRKDVKEKMGQASKETSKEKTFKVKIKVDNLNIRTGPGTDYSKTGKHTGVGTFVIVETKNGKGSDKGWGKLETSGWISMDYVTKI